MAKYRTDLPQLSEDLFLTDGGIETTLIFHDGLDLPHFSAIDALRYEQGRTALGRYFATYARIATLMEVGFILESPTWRASPGWGVKMGYSSEQLEDANRAAIDLMEKIRSEHETAESPMVISGCIGPRGDGYDPTDLMTPEEAERYHASQIGLLAETAVDLISAITMPYVDEAIGVTRAAAAVGVPVVISFTVETDGRLPTGETLQAAIEHIDAATDQGPAYYMINCAHPTHFDGALDPGSDWAERIRGLRANASSMSHAELDEAEELDAGDPEELGAQYREIRDLFPGINVLGGCCGTDHRHIEAIARACLDSPAKPTQ